MEKPHHWLRLYGHLIPCLTSLTQPRGQEWPCLVSLPARTTDPSTRAPLEYPAPTEAPLSSLVLKPLRSLLGLKYQLKTTGPGGSAQAEPGWRGLTWCLSMARIGGLGIPWVHTEPLHTLFAGCFVHCPTFNFPLASHPLLSPDMQRSLFFEEQGSHSMQWEHQTVKHRRLVPRH